MLVGTPQTLLEDLRSPEIVQRRVGFSRLHCFTVVLFPNRMTTKNEEIVESIASLEYNDWPRDETYLIERNAKACTKSVFHM